MNANVAITHLQPANQWAEWPMQLSPLRAAIAAQIRTDERTALTQLAATIQAHHIDRPETQQLAAELVQGLKNHRHHSAQANLIQDLLQTYTLSSAEGVALMCLAESLLRIPDAATRDVLIRDKICARDWRTHLGSSQSILVNAATWGLILTGRVIGSTQTESALQGKPLQRALKTGTEPLIRRAMAVAMQVMGHQFVAGQTIAKAIRHAATNEAKGYRYSYDMLGEAAMTDADAARYYTAYEQAIEHIGATAQGANVIERPGISIKLSALHPRYSRAQKTRVMTELYPKLRQLTLLAQTHNIGINIDAEETDRLELSLDLLEQLCWEPALANFNGIGFVIQAYQKRCPYVVDWLVDLAHKTRHRLMIRLVKGAYWDTEIKRAQVDGHSDYPVYTQKANTDVSYLVCAEKLLAAGPAIYPQFATHNAQTVAAIIHLAGPDRYTTGQYEFQCLHGMGEALYDPVVQGQLTAIGARPCRIYAPVGAHETLLAYLVRRLLENGANTSFINQVADKTIPIESLIKDPRQTVLKQLNAHPASDMKHPKIPLPVDILGPNRVNSAGLDLSDEATLLAIGEALNAQSSQPGSAPVRIASSAAMTPQRRWLPVVNPANHAQRVGEVELATPADVDTAFAAATESQTAWVSVPPAERARMLETAADLMSEQCHALMALLMREAGKTASNAIAEVREAVDFLRYDAAQIKAGFDNATHRPLGTVVCISPWNFPLAIFTGQIAASLAAGNTVIAKPAEQTPLIASRAVEILYQAGIPTSALQLLNGDGETIGAALVKHPAVAGVVFTGSTAVARHIQATLANRLGAGGQPIPLIAETGGQNAMIVDSSALTEQVVADILSSAFDSAGQRCSALRLLCIQRDVAAQTIEMLKGAMAALQTGDPTRLSTDVGPVIDASAKRAIDMHIASLRDAGCIVTQTDLSVDAQQGTFVPPTLIEIPNLHVLEHEVFGPVCHVIQYDRAALPVLIDQINALGFGLTMGLHTRSDATIEMVKRKAAVGNLYINRNQVGAVVGVQPFGGEGLSGTGPKAGGPLYLYRLLAQRPDTEINRIITPALNNGIDLKGPTGEHNQYRCAARAHILCLADDSEDLMAQTRAVLAIGGTPIWPTERLELPGELARDLVGQLIGCDDWAAPDARFDLVLLNGSKQQALHVQQVLARKTGAIVGLWRGEPGARQIPLERLVIERSVSNNTTASGGNTSLMRL